MEQVSKYLDTIIAVEEAPDATSSPAKSPRRSVTLESIHSLDKPDPPNFAGDASKYPKFWYLEDDQKKVSTQLSDKLIEKVLSVIIVADLPSLLGSGVRARMHKTRPPLSVALISANTTQMAQKTSMVFYTLDLATYVVAWVNPWQTVGALLMYTLMVLNPYLCTAVPPLVLVLLFLYPSYMEMYRPDPLVVDPRFLSRNPIPHDGAPLAKYEPPKAISQFSQEFLMNMTDLQNYMVAYVRLYDMLSAFGLHYFFFEDPTLSSAVVLILIATAALNVLLMPTLVPLFVRYVPVKALVIALGWAFVGSFHPKVRDTLLDLYATEEARLLRLDRINRIENAVMSMLVHADDEHEPHREVEVFELCTLRKHGTWELIGFTPDFMALNHPQRHLDEILDGSDDEDDDESLAEKSGPADVPETASAETTASVTDCNILHKATLAEVRPPKHWRFADEPWQIDLDPAAWVQASFILDLVTVDDEEKWVYDSGDAGQQDKHVFRRRRWTRRCVRENTDKEIRDVMSGGTGSERLSKTLSTLLL